MSIAWLTVLKAFTRSTKATYIPMLCLWRAWRAVLMTNRPSWHPTPGEERNFVGQPCSFITLNRRLHVILLNTLAPMSMRFTPLHLFGSERSPLFGTGTNINKYDKHKWVKLRQNNKKCPSLLLFKGKHPTYGRKRAIRYYHCRADKIRPVNYLCKKPPYIFSIMTDQTQYNLVHKSQRTIKSVSVVHRTQCKYSLILIIHIDWVIINLIHDIIDDVEYEKNHRTIFGFNVTKISLVI